MERKKRQLLISLIASEALIFFILVSVGLWGLVVALAVLEGLVVAGIFLRRTGRWPRWLSGPRSRWWIAFLVLVALLIFLLTVGVRLYTDWLWFGEVGYTSVFTAQVVTRVLLFIGTAVVVTLLVGGSMALALRYLPRKEWPGETRVYAVPPWRGRVALALIWVSAAVAGLVFGSVMQERWMSVLTFIHGVPVGKADPLFHQDIGFYLFRLPLLFDIKSMLYGLALVILLLTALVYALALRRRMFAPFPLAHLSVLGVLFLLAQVWDYRLKIYGLVYSRGGVTSGAGYTDVHARWPAYNILTAIVAVCAVLLLLNLWRRSWRLLAAGLGLWLISAIVVGAIYPALVQAFRVRPSELTMEQEYIGYSIEATLSAYGLDEVEEQEFPVTGTLTLEQVLENTGTIDNIRLWDHRPLIETYSQIQVLRQYYTFADIDVERYRLGEDYRQVELSVRELSVDLLPEQAQTWVNRHLVYTHGYGIVVSPVNEIGAEGQPVLFARNIPPETTYAELRLQWPQVYFGERTDNYIVVHTTAEEFDYPIGDQNQYARYAGRGGVPIDNFFRRLAFAIRFGDLPLLVSDAFTADSRILFHRTIRERVRTIAPFLRYDYDPYPVILDGRIYWIQDAYTVSDMYPYSEPDGAINYIRNSVKVVVDAYDGTTDFYIVDPTDPVVRTYAGMFPALFKPADQMPAGLKDHWRYPENLFRIQTRIFATYHMRDPKVFYNREDAWDFAKETYEGEEGYIDAYYVIMKLPGWAQEEFFLMVPFTPSTRDNMIAWMHAQCDGEDYGRLGVYKFPKQALVYGPFQIEARTNQDPIISQQITLWDQRGSNVIRGNLLVVPINHSLLYVAPLYLQAETGKIPELRRVIVAYGNSIAMAETLDQALRQVLGKEVVSPVEGRGWKELVRSAQEHYQKAQDCLKAGDWACYGVEMKALEGDLQELGRLSEEK